MNESFRKAEKLKSRTLIGRIFTEGSSLSRYPIRVIYLPLDQKNLKSHLVGVSVSRRQFKKAVDRIHLKRLMREAYRKNKYLVLPNGRIFAMMFLYTGKEPEAFQRISMVMQELLKKLAEKELGEMRNSTS